MSELLTKKPVPVDRGLQGVADRLKEEHEEAKRLERRLRAVRRRRELLVLKLTTGGVAERSIAAHLGCEAANIHQWKTKAMKVVRDTEQEHEG